MTGCGDGYSGKAASGVQQDMLLREMQHRVANSLQLVAGILSAKARTAECHEARFHLLDAYSRIVSVAAVQRQLLVSQHAGLVRLGDYLLDLGRTLENSFADNVMLSIAIDGNTIIESNKAVAIGLIATELVINALKHAFAGNRRGKIALTYLAIGSRWSFSVADDGVGPPNSGTGAVRAGYGKRLIDALAQQLDARVEVESGSNGTRVSVIRSDEGSTVDGFERAPRSVTSAGDKPS